MTSIFSGFVVFSILGYMAALQGKDITDPSIATDGMLVVLQTVILVQYISNHRKNGGKQEVPNSKTAVHTLSSNAFEHTFSLQCGRYVIMIFR